MGTTVAVNQMNIWSKPLVQEMGGGEPWGQGLFRPHRGGSGYQAEVPCFPAQGRSQIHLGLNNEKHPGGKSRGGGGVGCRLIVQQFGEPWVRKGHEGLATGVFLKKKHA